MLGDITRIHYPLPGESVAAHSSSMMTHLHLQSPYAHAICTLGLKNQDLISRSLDLGLVEHAKELRHLDTHLIWLLRKTSKFDFVGQAAKGKTLLIGEGNMSFALSLTRKQRINPANLTATTFERGKWAFARSQGKC